MLIFDPFLPTYPTFIMGMFIIVIGKNLADMLVILSNDFVAPIS